MLMKLSFIPCLVLSLSLMSLSALAETVPANRNQIAMSFAPLVKQTAPAVVNIYTRKLVRQRVLAPLFDDPMFQQFFGVPSGLTRERMENSLGSGVIVRRDGLVVTSAHVIQGADEIRIVLTDRREFSARTMIVDDKADLAVLQMDGGAENLPALALEDSDNVEVGDLVIAIGNPFGVGQTVTSGIVSALARTEVAHNNLNYFIQTDAAINPGNSGGALVGMDGRLLGINAAIYSKSGGNMGIGFAVPSNMVRAVVRPWLGIDGQYHAGIGELIRVRKTNRRCGQQAAGRKSLDCGRA
jgi:S1-C subfamily serine protease